jgi:Protein of unknown function (DUF3313)
MSRLLSRAVSGFTLVLAATATIAATVSLPPELASLVKIDARHVDEAYLLPGADFRPYTKVLIDPAEIAFRKDWQRNMSSSGRRISDQDAQKIADAARSGFAEIWDKAFRGAGYEIATAPAADVLRLSPQVIDLYINAPDVMTAGRSRSYAVEAGEATLVLQARDSETGATLGYAVDRQRTRSMGNRLQWTTSVSNKADFAQLFEQWARICVEALADLKEKSPLPAHRAGN